MTKKDLGYGPWENLPARTAADRRALKKARMRETGPFSYKAKMRREAALKGWVTRRGGQ